MAGTPYGSPTYKLKQLIKGIVTAPPVVYPCAALSWGVRRRKILQRNGQLRLHIGAGGVRLDGWVNIDIVPDPRLLIMRLPGGLRKFHDSSVEYIYASHLLEHLTYPDEVHEFLRHCRRILVPGGAMRLVVPDIARLMQAYSAADEAFFDAQKEMHPPWCTTKLEHVIYALQQDGEHKYGYDFETLKKALNECGFGDVRESDYRKSEIEALNIDYRSDVDPSGRSLHLHVDAIKGLA